MQGLRRGVALLAVVATLCAAAAVVRDNTAAAATPAPANAFSDIAGSPFAQQINWLAGLGFVTGDNGTLLTCTSNCTYRPNDPVTRAEFVKYVDEMAGLGGAAQALSGVRPNFSDGASIPSWAWGFVDVAQSNHYILGYPDGTFRAGSDITLAEALQVLLRVEGLGPAVTGPWPVGPIAAGARYGLNVDLVATGVQVGAGQAINRGEMAALVFDAYLKSPTGRVNVSTGVFQDNLAPLIFAEPANNQTLSCTGQVTGVPSANGGITLAASSLVEFTSGSDTGSCAPQLYQRFTTSPPLQAQFSNTVWLDGATGFTQLAGQTVTITTDAYGDVAVVLVRNLSSAAGATGSDQLNYGPATVPAGDSAVSINGELAPYLIQDSSGNFFLLFQDGKTQQVQSTGNFYFNNAPVITTDTDGDACGSPAAQFNTTASYGCDSVSSSGGVDTDGDEAVQPMDALQAFSAIVDGMFGGNVTAGQVEYAMAAWTTQKGENGASAVYVDSVTYSHALLETLDAPSFTIMDFYGTGTHTLTVSNATTVTLDGKAAELSALQPNDVVNVEVQGDVQCPSTGTCSAPVIRLAANRDVVTGSVTAISNGIGASYATVQTSGGQSQQIKLTNSPGSPPSPVNFTTLTPGAPVELALDNDGHAYWNLYNTSPNAWQPVVAEVTGTGRGNSGNTFVSLDTAGAVTNTSIQREGQPGLDALVAASQGFDPFVVVNTTNTDANGNAITTPLAVWNGSSIYGGGSGSGGTAPAATVGGVAPTAGPDSSGEIDFTSGANAGVTPLAPLLDLSTQPPQPAQNTTCTTDAGRVYETVYGTTYSQCTDVYQVTSLDATNGIVTLAELDGATGAPTGNYVTAYTSDGLTVFTQNNFSASSSGAFVGVGGLSPGQRVSLWGGPLDKAGHVLDVAPDPLAGNPVPVTAASPGSAIAGQVVDATTGETDYTYAPPGTDLASGAQNVPTYHPTGTTILGIVRLP